MSLWRVGSVSVYARACVEEGGSPRVGGPSRRRTRYKRGTVPSGIPRVRQRAQNQ
jgi:hypothetical protein